MPFDGKQIKTGSIPVTKLVALPSTPVQTTDPTSQTYVDNKVATALFNQDWKPSVRTASSTNITVSSPGATIGAVSMVSGDRALLYGQTTGSENGLYVWNGAAVPMTRALDANGNTSLNSQATVAVEEGTFASNNYKLTTPNPITIGTTALTFSFFSTNVSANPTLSNKDMAASTTASDNDIACATAVASTPNGNSFVKVEVNGVNAIVGDAVKTKECYFSGDSGTTARARNAVVSGDKLYWVGSVAGYQLAAANDLVSFIYNV